MKNKFIQLYIPLALILGIVIFVNIIAQYAHFSWDLTEENRYTLTKPTKKILRDLDEQVYVKILLNGNLPASIQRLQDATIEMLDDFRGHTGYLDYKLEDPGSGTTDEINERRRALAQEGVFPSSLRIKGVDETRDLIFYTYVMFYYKNRTVVVNLIDKDGGVMDEASIQKAITLMEYKLANAIQKVKHEHKPVVAFASANGELPDDQLLDMRRSLSANYQVGKFHLDSVPIISKDLNVLIFANPTKPFTKKQLFKIDQYMMNGGNTIWMVNKMNVSLDSLYGKSKFLALERQLNLDDLFFKYGARLQPNLLLDLQCSKIPLAMDKKGNMDMFDWYYHIVSTPDTEHPIAKNMDGVNLLFPSKIDTIKTKTPVKKTILLTTTENSREQLSPVELNFEICRYPPIPDKFKEGKQPVAVLLEGEFPSLFEGRVSAEMRQTLEKIKAPFKKKSENSKMLIISDGEFVRNYKNPRTDQPQPAGFNKYVNYTFANKPFLINAIDYMNDGEGVMVARSKDFKLRLLDTIKAKKEKTFWQFINIVLPLILLTIFGFVFNFIRKKKYTNN